MLPIITAFVEGRTIQAEHGDAGWLDEGETCSFARTGGLYRIKPTPKLRPWNPEEVPKCAMCRRFPQAAEDWHEERVCPQCLADAKLGRMVRSEKIWNVERREKTLAWGDPDPNTGRRLPAASAVYYSVGACNRPGVVDWFDGATPEEALEKAGITEGDGE